MLELHNFKLQLRKNIIKKQNFIASFIQFELEI